MDDGSEVRALFVLPPLFQAQSFHGRTWSAPSAPTRSPYLSGYEVVEFSLEVASLNRELLAWEITYNTIRPHQALAYLTPHQFLTQWQSQRKEAQCH